LKPKYHHLLCPFLWSDTYSFKYAESFPRVHLYVHSHLCFLFSCHCLLA
jgi:hypothetical protein